MFTVSNSFSRNSILRAGPDTCALLVLPLFSISAFADQNSADGRRFGGNRNKHGGKFCSKTADLQFAACRNEAEDDYFTGTAKCTQMSDTAERDECLSDANDSRKEGKM